MKNDCAKLAPMSELDAVERAWLARDYEKVEAEAKQLHEAPGLLWLGLAQVATERLAQAHATLKRAFAHGQADQSQLHAAANRLVDLLAHDAIQSVGIAHFIVEALALEHPASLRLLAEDIALREQDPVRAAALLKRALTSDPVDPESHYLIARLLARMGKNSNVLKHLHAAVKYGAERLSVGVLARHEPDFEVLRQDPEFQKLFGESTTY
jgi:tetratricopeptide (TPR) repeat protein